MFILPPYLSEKEANLNAAQANCAASPWSRSSGLECENLLHKIKPMKKSIFILTILSFVFSTSAHAGLLFNYSQLLLKDLDQMNEMVLAKVEESKKSSSGKNVPLKEALQSVYSRPNDDQMIDKVVAPLRTHLDELDEWERTLSQLTDEAINALKNPRAFKPVVQVTYQIFLENSCSSFLWVNREQDMGVEGVRQAKESYNPAHFLRKYRATWKG